MSGFLKSVEVLGLDAAQSHLPSTLKRSLVLEASGALNHCLKMQRACALVMVIQLMEVNMIP